MMAFDLDSLLLFSFVFLVLSTGIQLIARWKTKSQVSEKKPQYPILLSEQESPKAPRKYNDPIEIDKVDEHTILMIDRMMKGV